MTRYEEDLKSLLNCVEVQRFYLSLTTEDVSHVNCEKVNDIDGDAASRLKGALFMACSDP